VPGTNREQLLAAGWAACFQSSMQRFAFACKVDLSDPRVTARVGIGTLESGGFGLAAALDFDAPQVSRADALELMRRAHKACPYSQATRGNIDVTLAVGGTSVALHAA
jgi:osmotically inducible protein OsmC